MSYYDCSMFSLSDRYVEKGLSFDYFKIELQYHQNAATSTRSLGGPRLLMDSACMDGEEFKPPSAGGMVGYS